MEFDKAIINPNSDIELASLMNDIIKLYRKEHEVYVERGQCFRQSMLFIDWLFKEGFTNDNFIAEVWEGLYIIDNPEKLPLNIMDLEQDEYEEFMDLYEDVMPPTDYSDGVVEYELSELIWKYLIEYVSEDRLSEFFAFDHAWVDIDGLIIDFTWEQFKDALDDLENLRERYEY